MRQEDEKWMEALRTRMEQHQPELPPAVWERMEKELPAIPVQGKKSPRRKRLLAWYLAPVATVAAVLLWVFWPASTPQRPESDRNKVTIITPSEIPAPQERLADQEQSAKTELAAKACQTENSVLSSGRQQPVNQLQSATALVSQDVDAMNGRKQEETREPAPSINLANDGPSREVLPDTILPITPRQSQETGLPNRIREKHRLTSQTLLLAVSGLPSTMQETGTSGWHNSPIVAPPLMFSSAGTLMKPERVLEEVSNLRSFGLGLNFRMPLSSPRHLYLETGLAYTNLGYDARFTRETWKKENLHYLGVPVLASWQCLEFRRWALSLAAGGQLDKCISTRLSDDHPWQGSLRASCSLTYNLSSRTGIYLEPALRYYFENDSRQDYFSAGRNTLFELKAGVRLEIN